ncbi:MAG: DUF3971 domain-containing protein [Cyclobacteriaceae bacterium]|nr:DUF3971 domain-containing protein [Cyclobacteriaceae bacterium]
MAVVVVSSSISVYLYKDRLIQKFISEVNQHINTPIHVEKIDVSVLEHLPYISIDFNDVIIEESYTWSDDPLITAQKVALSFNPFNILQGSYTVKQMHIVNGTISLKINRKGENNFSIIENGGGNSTTVFDLNKISLNNVEMLYNDLSSDKKIELSTQQLSATLNIEGGLYNITAKGDVLSNNITFNGSSFLENKSFYTNAKLVYDQTKKWVTIAPSKISAYESDFLLKGDYGLTNNKIDISLSNDETNLKTLLALVPVRYTNRLEKYNSNGNGYFNLSLNGMFQKGQFPSINVSFGFSEAAIYHPDFSTQLDSVTLTGMYESPDFMDLTKASLSLNNVSGRLDNQPFSANLLLNNFTSPFIDVNFKGDLKMTNLLKFYPKNGFVDATGVISSNISLKGNIQDLKTKSTVNKVKTNGELNLQNVNFLHKESNIPFKELNGGLIFNNNDLTLTDFSGNIGSSNFLLNGLFKNFAAYVLLDNQPIGIEADLTSTLIDMDELLSGNFTSEENTSENYSFSISPNLQLKFNCNIDQLKFRRFLGNNIQGDLLVKNQVMATNSISVNTMDGHLTLSGSADASTDSVFVYSEATLDKIAMDQIFFVFENFKQDFLVDTHLKGSINADITSFLAFDKHLNFNAKEMMADISATIEGGELNNFEPMQNLSDYLDEQELSALRFSALKNDIHIENETIYIPNMEIKSNATNITIGGTHTFRQEIDYSVVAPLNNRKRIDKDTAFGAIEEDNSGRAKVFLKITGTTDDYKVSYDTRALKKEVISDFKKEVKELKDAFRTKGKTEKKEVVLEDDDYFDW